MMGTKARLFTPVPSVTLEDLVPADHFYRHLDRALDLRFVRDLVSGSYAVGGRPSIDPVVFFKLQLVMFFEGLRSERQLLRVAADRLSVRWYLGFNLDESLPDHSSLTKIRQRLGLPLFRRFFEHIVQLCIDAGLVWGKELFFDATKVRANAAIDSLVPRLREVVDGHLVDLFGPVPACPSPATMDTMDTDDAPSTSIEPVAQVDAAEKKEENIVLYRQAAAETAEGAEPAPAPRWDLLEQCRLDPDRPASGSYRRKSDRTVSTTDPDAVLMRTTGQKASLGYHDHYVVDGGKARIILHALVTPADVMENEPMLDQLRRVMFRWKLHPGQAVADTTYATAENIRELEKSGIRAYVPLADWDRTPYYGPSRFTYDSERDEYRCPRGEPLRRWAVKNTERVWVYRADPAKCNACPLKEACTQSDAGRIVHRSFDAEYFERVRGYHSTAVYQKAMRKRKVWIEPLFGEAKQWHGMRQFRLRGLVNVNVEGLLIAAGQNLKRWLTRTGWGHRHGPAGSLALVSALAPTSTLRL